MSQASRARRSTGTWVRVSVVPETACPQAGSRRTSVGGSSRSDRPCDGGDLNRDARPPVSCVGGSMPESPAVVMRQLHDEHAAALWGFCLRLTGGNRAQAEDVAQETLLRAW